MSGTCKTICELCGEKAEFANSVPDHLNATQGNMAYRLKPLCWIHASEARQDNCSRIVEILDDGDTGRVDHGRASGDVICPDCNREYRRHPANASYPFLNQLCDGSLVKL